ncbi:MAG: helix-turn-helix domain-containing protein, partial [Acidobacteria bacterium]|nr:helix-turn-helix domain-containing protein [Acidobacteriota bacterium]
PKGRRYDFADCCDQADKALKRAIATIEGGHVDPPQIELSATQAADLARVSYSALLGELRRGSIPNRRVGNRYRIRVADLVMWIRRQR